MARGSERASHGRDGGVTTGQPSSSNSALLPATAAALADAVRDTAGPLRIVGAGTWLDAGKPARDATPLRLDAFRGVRAYVPADLTISVGAATTLGELDEITAANGQYYPLFPWGGDDGSVGATVATATPGPFTAALGRPRDLVLGLECVDGRGRVVRAGGKVVKNVAGFDLTRLMTGAWGTLGVITELHLRLRARPTVDETWLLRADGPRSALALAELLRSPLAPLGCVPLTPRLAAALKLQVGEAWLIRIGGNAAFVSEARRALSSIGSSVAQDPASWRVVRAAAAPEPSLGNWRWDALSQRLKANFDPRDILNRGLLGAVAGAAA